MLSHFSRILLFAILRTVACQVPLSLGLSRQVYWSGLPIPSPGNLPNPGIEPESQVYCIGQGCSLPLAPPRKPHKDCDIDYEIDWEVH